jgi:hypothetical protein
MIIHFKNSSILEANELSTCNESQTISTVVQSRPHVNLLISTSVSNIVTIDLLQSYSIANCGNTIASWFRYKNTNYNALFAIDKIPLWLRILFPIAVLLNISLFITANIQVGTSVMVEIDIGNKVISPPSIFDFGLANTVRDMWTAGVYPLSILIAFFSGVWPYIKLISMLVSWFTPTSILTQSRRESILRWLDVLGKWSLLDAYVMVMMMVAFHVELEVAPGLSVIVTVLPKSGFNNFLLATMMSLGLGHIALAGHRLENDSKSLVSDNATEALMNHIFTWKIYNTSLIVSNDGSFTTAGGSYSTTITSITTDTLPAKKLISRKMKFTYWGKFVMIVSLLFTALVVIAGAFLMTFSFHFEGLTGYLLKSDADVSYSLISTGTSMSTATGDPNSFNVRWIQAAFFGFGIAMPLGFITVLLILWTIPLTLSTFKQFVVFAEVANAWNAIDVFVVSIIAALLEIHQFALFIIGDSCDGINKILAEYMDEELNGNDTCFDVAATIKTVSYIIFLLF